MIELIALAESKTARPTALHKSKFFAFETFDGSPPAVRNIIPPIIIIKGTIAKPIQKIKSQMALMISGIVSYFKGFSMLTAKVKFPIKNKNPKTIIIDLITFS